MISRRVVVFWHVSEWILSLVLISSGVAFQLSPVTYNSAPIFDDRIWFPLIVSGSVILLISIVGLFAACKQNKNILVLYGCLKLVTTIFLYGIGIFITFDSLDEDSQNPDVQNATMLIRMQAGGVWILSAVILSIKLLYVWRWIVKLDIRQRLEAISESVRRKTIYARAMSAINNGSNNTKDRSDYVRIA